MPNPPYTKIVQVNTANSNTRVVRCEIEAETASQPALPAQNTVAESDAVVVWEFQGKMQGKTVQWEQYNDSDTNLLEVRYTPRTTHTHHAHAHTRARVRAFSGI